MKYRVFVIAEAEEDIVDLHTYVRQNDSPDRASRLFNHLRETIESLSEIPERGHVPPELLAVSVMNYREIHWKPYRIIYQIEDGKVFVHAVLDGRRDLQELLERRLLR